MEGGPTVGLHNDIHRYHSPKIFIALKHFYFQTEEDSLEAEAFIYFCLFVYYVCIEHDYFSENQCES